MLLDVSIITVGFALLVAGAELLVRGAVGLAGRLKVSAFVIGAVVVGFGSSTPELVTSIEAGIRGAPGIAIGSIVGSNIINILVVIGIAAVIAPITLSSQNVRPDTVIVCALSTVFVAVCTVADLSPAIGVLFVVGLAIYLTYSIRREMSTAVQAPRAGEVIAQDIADQSSSAKSGQTTAIDVAAAAGGLILVVLGGHFVVDAAVSLAKVFGASEAIIGLTVVACGTSLPEIVTAAVAALRRCADVALGNVLGSCIFNLLAVGGAIAIIAPASVPAEIIRFDNLVMLAATLLLLLAVSLSRHIGRPLGALFLGGYAVYLAVIWP